MIQESSINTLLHPNSCKQDTKKIKQKNNSNKNLWTMFDEEVNSKKILECVYIK